MDKFLSRRRRKPWRDQRKNRRIKKTSTSKKNIQSNHIDMGGLIRFVDERVNEDHITEQELAELSWTQGETLEETDAMRAFNDRAVIRPRFIVNEPKPAQPARRINFVLDNFVREAQLDSLPSQMGQLILNYLLVPHIRHFFTGLDDTGQYELLQFHDENHRSGVCDAFDKANERRVMMKRFSFESVRRRTELLRKFLRCIVAWECKHVVDIVDIIMPQDTHAMRNVIVVFAMQVSKSLEKVDRRALTDLHAKHIIYQILLGLKAIQLCTDYSLGEMRLGNVFVDRNGHAQIGFAGCPGIVAVERDVDLVRSESEPTIASPRVTQQRSRKDKKLWLKRSRRMQNTQVDVPFAPEVILHSVGPDVNVENEMSRQTDLWGVGYILSRIGANYEIRADLPYLCPPNQLPKRLLEAIMIAVGPPKIDYAFKFSSSGMKKVFLEASSQIDEETGELERGLSRLGSDHKNLLLGLLKFDPDERGSVDDALVQPFFDEIARFYDTDFSAMEEELKIIKEMDENTLVENIREKLMKHNPKGEFAFQDLHVDVGNDPFTFSPEQSPVVSPPHQESPYSSNNFVASFGLALESSDSDSDNDSDDARYLPSLVSDDDDASVRSDVSSSLNSPLTPSHSSPSPTARTTPSPKGTLIGRGNSRIFSPDRGMTPPAFNLAMSFSPSSSISRDRGDSLLSPEVPSSAMMMSPSDSQSFNHTPHSTSTIMSPSFESSQNEESKSCIDSPHDVEPKPVKRASVFRYPPSLEDLHDLSDDDDEATTPVERMEKLRIRAESPTHPNLRIRYGMRVYLTGAREGYVRYIGCLRGKKGVYFGISLTQGKGNNNGRYNGISYFICDTVTISNDSKENEVQSPSVSSPSRRKQTLSGAFVRSSMIKACEDTEESLRIADVTLGDRVRVKLGGGRECVGIVRSMGIPPKSKTSRLYWGVEVIRGRGTPNCNGYLHQIPYFKCRAGCGAFVTESRIRKTTK